LGDCRFQSWRIVSRSPAAIAEPYFSAAARMVVSSDDRGETGINGGALEADDDD
jgi:hypothetical protein